MKTAVILMMSWWQKTQKLTIMKTTMFRTDKIMIHFLQCIYKINETLLIGLDHYKTTRLLDHNNFT